MKTKLLFMLLVVSATGFSQTAEKKNNISIGGGKQSYNGDLGNAWFNPEEEFYGFVSIAYSHYINKSFDATLSVSTGDYGHCREQDEPRVRPDGTPVLNMLSRLTNGVVSAKYKFANGYLLKEDAKLAPYLYAGAGINNISEFWWSDKTRAHTGNYASLNGGIGIKYNFNQKINLGYNLGFGYFMKDNIDDRSENGNDMYMQHCISIGLNF